MRTQIITFPNLRNTTRTAHRYSQNFLNYDAAEQQFIKLLETEDLDYAIEDTRLTREFEAALTQALAVVFKRSSTIETDAANIFLHHVLYRINRLKLFWYDDLTRYKNERSIYLRDVRDRIEKKWHEWEWEQVYVDSMRQIDVRAALAERVKRDLDPPASVDGVYFRDEAGIAAYRRLLEIISLDALVEASQLSRTLGGVGNEIHSMLTRLLLEEYGVGRLERKHSTYFESMLRELNLNTAPEGYFNCVPWQVLAAINHSFLLSERKRYFLRYIGGLLHTEISVPSSFCNYQAAAERMGLHAGALSYWQLHIREDERHGQWMLNDVALPLIERYPTDAWEIVLGYDQQRYISARAGTSTRFASTSVMASPPCATRAPGPA